MARLSPQLRDVVKGVRSVRLGLTPDGPWTVADVAVDAWHRGVGLLGRRDVSRPLLLTPCSSVHSVGMLVDLDVAYLDADLRVLETAPLPRWRVHVPRRGAAAVLETATGGLAALGVRPGTRLVLARDEPAADTAATPADPRPPEPPSASPRSTGAGS